MQSLQSYFEQYPKASLRRLSQATQLNYNVLLRKAKEPVPNMVYDYNAINWRALERYLARKGIDWNTLDWQTLNADRKQRKAFLPKSISVFAVGDKVYLRQNPDTPYQILYMTDTNIVIMLEGSSEPQVWSHSTFMVHGPTFRPRSTNK